MSIKNSTVLGRIWLQASNDFQQRIPNPSIQGIAYNNVYENLFAPMNNDLFNEFSGLLNGLLATYVDVRRFENPIEFLKRPASQFGFSERHIAINYLQAHSYRVDSETLLKVEKPEYSEWFYSLNRFDRYEFSWSRQELAQAFAQDGYGFEDLLAGTITQMLSSAAYDEMNIMLQMFAEADNRTDGLYRYHLSAEPTDEATAKELLKGIRSVAGRMRFPSMLFNALPVPVHTDGSRLVLYVLPEVLASLDVDALSAVFQLPYANPEEVAYRIITVPEFPIPNVCAILCDEDFIYYRDFMTGMEPPFYNPENRTLKYYYFAQAAVGFNPAAPCCVFTTDEATTIPTVTMAITGAEFDPAEGQIEIGGTLPLKFALTGTVTGDTSGKIAVEPDAATYEVSAARVVDEGQETEAVVPVALNSRTYVDRYGVLHLQKSGIEVGDTIVVTAKSAYINPSGETTEYTAGFEATAIAPVAQGAKECAVSTDPYITYTDTTEEVTASE